jgi:ATP-dependent Clp protease ATP-binding subunit ClpA
LKMICKKEIESLINRIDRKNVKIKVSDSVYNFMIEARKSEHGINAMIVDRIISKHIEPKLADALLQLENNSQIFYNITITVVKNEITIRKKIKS